jgi:hypothetical protein
MDNVNTSEVKTFWNEWEQYQSYLSSKNYPKVFKENVDFYEGRQWSGQTVLDIPPVTVNEVRAITDIKTSNILATPFSTSFKRASDTDETLTVKLNNFDTAILKELNHDLINRRLVNSNAIKGVFCLHYYWNEDYMGTRGLYKGGLQCEVLNPLHVAVSNPTETDIQKMEYVIIGTPMKVNKVKKMAKNLGLSEEEIEMIRDDNDLVDEEKYDLSDDKTKKKCVVLTKYFRQNGEVYFQRCTKNVMLGDPRPMNPNLSKKLIKESLESETKDKYVQDPESAPVQDGDLTNGYDGEVWNLYPIEMNSLTPSDNSIYGLSDVSDIIMLQKMLNVSFATGYKNSLDNVFPKYFAKKGALQQEITGEPNEVIYDHYQGSGWGIQKVEGVPLSNAQVGLPQTIIEFMKTVSNSRDVLQGDTVGANMSAVAIQSLQVQAEKPIAQQREIFIQSLVRMARIRLLFYKFFYHQKRFSYDMEDYEYEFLLEKENYSPENPIAKNKIDTFEGDDYLGSVFDVIVDVGRGTKYDAITAQETLNNLFMNNNLDKMDSDKFELYITGLDSNICPFKDDLRKIMRKQRQSEKAMLTQQVQALTQQLEASNMKNNQLLLQIEALKGEFTNKINQQNALLKDKDSAIKNAEDTFFKLMNLNNGTKQQA